VQRVVRLALVVLLGIAIGVVAFVALLIVTNPQPRQAEGWTLLAPLPTARGETAAAVADGQLYVIGGMAGLDGQATDEVSVYDPASGAWTDGLALPDPRHHAAAAGLESTVYVSGGGPSAEDWTPQPTLWALDTLSQAWRELSPMPDPRLGHRMVAIDGRLYVVGGVGFTADVLIYDPVADAWSTGAPMPAPRNHLAAVVVDHEIWAIGGRSSSQIHTRVDIYDTTTDTWRAGPPLPEPTSGAAEAVIDGVIFISGGEDPRGTSGVIDRNWQLDARSGPTAQWEALSPPPLPVHGAHGAALGGRFLIVGGALRPGAFSRLSWTASAQAFTPKSPP